MMPLLLVLPLLLPLQKVKLVDAGFIWTEPHSKRLKVKLTIQDEVMNGTILQQGFVVEFVVENHMCMDCNRANANPNSWTACVQVGRGGRRVDVHRMPPRVWGGTCLELALLVVF